MQLANPSFGFPKKKSSFQHSTLKHNRNYSSHDSSTPVYMFCMSTRNKEGRGAQSTRALNFLEMSLPELI